MALTGRRHPLSGQSARKRALLWVALLALLAPGCEGEREALAGNGGFFAVMNDVPLGEQWATMNASLHNTSTKPLIIRTLTVAGPGIGSVVRVLDTMIAPIPADHDSLSVTSGGVWRTYPPVQKRGQDCAIQTLEPVEGFVLPPGGVARALLLLEATSVGRFKFKGVEVSYEQDGKAGTELVDFGQEGTVITHGKPVPDLAGSELACAHLARVLPSGAPSA